MSLGFSDRFEFAAQMHRRYLSHCMAAYWAVDDDAITPMHGDSDGAMAADMSGIDSIVSTNGGAPVFVAERVRTLRDRGGELKRPDFSLRVETARGDDSEFRKLMNAFRTGASLPKCYLFGIAAADNCEDALERGLSVLYWLDTEQIFAAIDDGQLHGSEFTTHSGEVTRYYEIEDLRNAGCVDAETSGLPLKSATDPERQVSVRFPGVEARGQTVQTRVNGGEWT